MFLYDVLIKNPITNNASLDKYSCVSSRGKYANSKDALLFNDSGNMPAWASEPRRYWKAVDDFERVNGRLSVQILFSLPLQLGLESHVRIVNDFIKVLIGENLLPYTFSIRNDIKKVQGLATGEEILPHNPYCYLMISERINDGKPRIAEEWFKNVSANKPGARKIKLIRSSRDTPKIIKQCAVLQEKELKRVGFDL